MGQIEPVHHRRLRSGGKDRIIPTAEQTKQQGGDGKAAVAEISTSAISSLRAIGGRPIIAMVLSLLLVLSVLWLPFEFAARIRNPPVGEVVLQYRADGDERRADRGLVAASRRLDSFPSVDNSTVLFLHVFKCGGTSLREVLTTWAKSAGWSGAVVEYCRSKKLTNVNRICLNSQNTLVDPVGQKWLVRGSKLLAGHFFWDFRHHVTAPYLMVTTLRNPLELFVSSQQFKHKDQTATLADAVEFVSGSMRKRLTWEDPTDIAFIRRFLETETANSYDPKATYPKEKLMDMARAAVEHLNTFFVVGVIEQYEGFIEVMKVLLDPGLQYARLWKAAVGVKDNGSPVHSSEVLRHIDPYLVSAFNYSALGLQWKVYDVALQLWDQRCREVLSAVDHRALCTVRDHR